jgi:hypothetical protein
VTPARSRLVRSIPVTVVSYRSGYTPPDSTADDASGTLTDTEIAALERMHDARPVALVEHLDNRQLQQLAFVRWLRANGHFST